MADPVNGEIVQRAAVTVFGVKEGLTVGPDEVLVVVLEETWDRKQVQAVVDRLADALRPDQYIVIAGGARIYKAAKSAGPQQAATYELEASTE